jgi:hypothetical protein
MTVQRMGQWLDGNFILVKSWSAQLLVRDLEKGRFRGFAEILSSPCGDDFWTMLLIRWKK